MTRISVRINDTVIDRWQSYSIENDMLNPADSFSMTLAPAIRDVYDLVPPDSVVDVRIDDTAILQGYVDERSISIEKGSPTITINGRDKVGRMIDESAPLGAYGTKKISDLAFELAQPQFSTVVVTNARNRRLLRGRRSNKAAAGTEPIFTKLAQAPKKVEPGETRWDVLQQFLEPARLLAWSSGDGQEFIVGKPNYTQGTQWRFVVPAHDSDAKKKREGNVLSANVTTSVANRYSSIRVTGASKGDGKNYGPRVNKHTATVEHSPGDNGGENSAGFHGGSDFSETKSLILSDPDVKSESDAKERAERELRLRDAERLVLDLTVKGHNQALFRNDTPAIFCFDTLADVEIEPIGLSGVFLITSVRFTVSKTEGEVTQLRLVPKGAELVT